MIDPNEFLIFNEAVSLLGSAKVNIFSGPCYLIKCVLMFVSGVRESVLVDFISQNFA